MIGKEIIEHPVRIAVVGAGLIGKRHIDAVRRSDVACITSIVDPDRSTGEFAAQHGLDWHLTISEMLRSDSPDGVIIATPNQLHVEHGLECVHAKLPALIEKPIAVDTQSAIRLVKEAEARGIPILVGHHRRHNPILQAAKRQIDSGIIGDVVAVQAMCWLYKPDNYFDAAWRTQPGAGPVFINLIHDVDVLRYLIGEVQSVQACDANQARGYDIEDTAAIILNFANGALATITVSDTIVSPWSWELTAEENPAYPVTGQDCYLIGGTHGSIAIPSGKIWFQKGERSWWQPISQDTYEVKHRDPLDLQITHFCDVIARKTDPLVSGREAVRTLKVIEAIKDSARSGRTTCPIELD